MKKKTVVFAWFILFAFVFTAGLAAQSRNSVEWPDNEYTRQVPRPPFPIRRINDMSSSVGLIQINFVEGTVEGTDAFIEQLKAAGFTNNVKHQRVVDAGGNTVIQFDGYNAGGWCASFRYMGDNAVAMTINRPK